jgi:DNA-directed RNA polymerase specialized sigma24 family protein
MPVINQAVRNEKNDHVNEENHLDVWKFQQSYVILSIQSCASRLDCCPPSTPPMGTPMTSPSPSDLLWVIGFTPHGRWVLPIVRAAVRAEWPTAQQIARSQLGNEDLACELMESAIAQTHEYLESQLQATIDDAREILIHHYRNGVRRHKRANARLVLRGTGADLESVVPSPISPDTIEARLDVDTILRDTPAEMRHALLARYGARSQWDEVAAELNKSKDSIRVASNRELDRLRKKVGVMKSTSKSGC